MDLRLQAKLEPLMRNYHRFLFFRNLLFGWLALSLLGLIAWLVFRPPEIRNTPRPW